MSVAAGRIDGARVGRPLRFLAATLGGWTLFRTVMLWPVADTPEELMELVVPPVAAAERPTSAVAPVRAAKAHHRAVVVRPARSVAQADPISSPKISVAEPVQRPPVIKAVPILPPPIVPEPLPRAASRWSGSAWAVARGDGGGRDVLGGSQLGGSQAGARIAYAVGSDRRAALVARFATPLEGSGREMGLGVELRVRPGLRLVAEQRVALGGGRGGPSAFAVGGVGPVPVAGVRLEAYGQAGAVKRQRLEPFADGAVRMARLVSELGRVQFDLGIGAWGGAQRDAARLDLGPSLGAVLPVGRRSIRVTLDWRQRVAGDARPGSGPALSAGMDF